MPTRKNPHAVALGRLGGQARARKLSRKQRREIATAAAKAAKRWREANPLLASQLATKAAKASHARGSRRKRKRSTDRTG